MGGQGLPLVAEGLAWHFLDPPHQLGHSPGLLPFGPHL